VLDAMLGPGIRKAERAGPHLDSALLDVLEAVERGEETCDAIAAELDLGGADVASALATLEALGYVTCSLVGVYSRTLLTVPGV
jgi:predicted Rossmann fold nucleotide-binding protein DprA/Smf involved in DNA uptake